VRVAIAGGNANNGANDGPWYWNLNNDSSNANQNIGAHLKFCNKIKRMTQNILTSW